MNIGLSSLKMTDTGLIKATSYFTNKDFVSEVVITEVGLFGKLENEPEILICYVNDGYGESFPPGDSGNILQKQRSFEFGIDRNTKVTAVVSSTMFATVIQLEEELKTKEPTIKKNTAFNKDFGTISGTVLEGSKLAEALGANYGGIINNTLTKTAGVAYYDTATKAIYLCKVNNNLNYADLTKFEDFSNKGLLGKLQNLDIVLYQRSEFLNGNVLGTINTLQLPIPSGYKFKGCTVSARINTPNIAENNYNMLTSPLSYSVDANGLLRYSNLYAYDGHGRIIEVVYIVARI
ncbi:MAG: hypothetical protein ACRC6K_04350, partial [Fusobacteriaceae bacterium]